MTNTRQYTLAVVFVVTLLAPALAQDASIPKFSSRSDLVLVPVVVHERGDKPVSGLTKEQFVLTDGGKQRQLAVFEEVKASNAPAAPRERGKNEFGNYVADPQNARRVTVIAWDLLNGGGGVRPRRAVLDYLKKHLDPQEPTTLLVLDRRGLHQLHSFTTDTSVLIKAVESVDLEFAARDAADSKTYVAPSYAGLDSLTIEEASRLSTTATNADLMLDALVARDRTYMTLRAFEEIAQGYAGIPGRKALLWISAGFPFDIGDAAVFKFMVNEFMEPYQTVWKLFNTANISVYPVDVVGLVAVAPTYIGPDPRWITYFPPTLDVRRDYHDTFRSFAQETGGKACINNNDIRDCLERAARDADAYYLLGFYLPPQDRKMGWHKLSLKVNGTYSDLRYRRGYFIAREPSPEEKAHAEKASLLVAAQSPIDFTALPMDVVIQKITPVGKSRKVDFLFSLPPGSFTIDEQHGNLARIKFTAYVRDARFKKPSEKSETIVGSLDPDTATKLTAEGLAHKGEIEVVPGKYSLRCVARDELTGKMGTVTVPLDID